MGIYGYMVCLVCIFGLCSLIEALQLEVFFFPMTFKSLLFPLDIDTLGLVERYGN